MVKAYTIMQDSIPICTYYDIDDVIKNIDNIKYLEFKPLNVKR